MMKAKGEKTSISLFAELLKAVTVAIDVRLEPSDALGETSGTFGCDV